MNNKKVLLILLASILALLISLLMFKRIPTADETKAVIKPEIQEEIIDLTTIDKEEEKENIDILSTENIKKPIVENINITPQKDNLVVTEERNEKELTLDASVEKQEENSNIIVIDKEYKIKTPAKYTFK